MEPQYELMEDGPRRWIRRIGGCPPGCDGIGDQYNRLVPPDHVYDLDGRLGADGRARNGDGCRYDFRALAEI